MYRTHLKLCVAGITLLCCCVGANGSIAGTPLSLHSGTTDPSTEGYGAFFFLPGSPFGQPQTGPIVNDNGSGFDAWKINSMNFLGDPTRTAIFGVYERFWTPAEKARLSTSPREFTVRLRMVDDRIAGADPSDAAAAAFVEFNGRGYRPIFGIRSGMFELGFFGIGVVATAVGPNDYHTLQMQDYDRDGTFAVFLDNTFVMNYAGVAIADTTGNNRIVFGDGSGSNNWDADVNYSLIQLNVPEPASMSVLGLASLGLLARRRCARRARR